MKKGSPAEKLESQTCKCRWPDSNRHGFPLDFESSASANSATPAYVITNKTVSYIILAQKQW